MLLGLEQEQEREQEFN